MPFALSKFSVCGIAAAIIQDPFADQPQTGKDPFADQPQTGQGPFADQSVTGQDPFEDENSVPQAPKLQPREIPAEPEQAVDQNQQAGLTEFDKSAANKDQSSETGVSTLQTQPKLPQTTSIISDFDYLYLLPLLLVPIILGWLWVRGRRNRAFKIDRYQRAQLVPLASQPNGQRLPARRKAVLSPRNKQQPVPNQPQATSGPERFRTAPPSNEEIELSLDESGEELHLGDLSAISDRDSEEFDFSAESDLELETDAPPETVRDGSERFPKAPDNGPGRSSKAKTSFAKAGARSGEKQKNKQNKPLTATTSKVAVANQATPVDLGAQVAELHAVADKFELEIGRLNQTLLTKAQLEQELETANRQVAELSQKIETANDSWKRRFDEQKKLQQELENRAVAAESLLADAPDKSVLDELQIELNAVKTDFDATRKQKDSLAQRLAELEARTKLAAIDVSEKLETAQAAMARAEALAVKQLAEGDKKANARLTAIQAEYEAKLADLKSQAAANVAEAEEKAAAGLAEAKSEAARKLVEIEAKTAAKTKEAEKRAATTLAEERAKAAKKLAEVESQAAENIAAAEKTFADQLAKAKLAASNQLAEVEAKAAEKVASTEENAAAKLAAAKAEAAARITKVESEAAEKIARAEAKVSEQLAGTPNPSDFAKLQANATAEIETVKEQAAVQIAEVRSKADARIADVETQTAAKLAEAEKQAASAIANAKANAEAIIEAKAAARLAESEKQAAEQLAETRAETQAKVKAAEAQAAARLAEVKEKAARAVAEAKSHADARIAEFETQAAEKLGETRAEYDAKLNTLEAQAAASLAKAEEQAESKLADALAKADARFAALKAQAEKKISAAKAAAKASLAETGGAVEGELSSESVAEIVRQYKKERARRIDIEKMLDEAEEHRSELSKQIKHLQNQFSSNSTDSE